MAAAGWPLAGAWPLAAGVVGLGALLTTSVAGGGALDSVPGMPPARHEHLTCHQGIAPTFLRMLGVENRWDDYSQGRPLLDGEPEHHVTTCGWGECAMIDGHGTVTFSLGASHLSGLGVRDAQYREVPDVVTAVNERAPELVEVVHEMAAFLR